MLTNITITIFPSIVIIINNQLGIKKDIFHLFVLTHSSHSEMKLFFNSSIFDADLSNSSFESS